MYLQYTTYFGLQFFNSGIVSLIVFSDDDSVLTLMIEEPLEVIVFLGSNIVSRSSKKQHIIFRSLTGSEYKALALETSEILYPTCSKKSKSLSFKL